MNFQYLSVYIIQKIKFRIFEKIFIALWKMKDAKNTIAHIFPSLFLFQKAFQFFTIHEVSREFSSRAHTSRHRTVRHKNKIQRIWRLWKHLFLENTFSRANKRKVKWIKFEPSSKNRSNNAILKHTLGVEGLSMFLTLHFFLIAESCTCLKRVIILYFLQLSRAQCE